MKRKAIFAGLCSLLVPGLGQIFGGRGGRGAAVLAGAIIIGYLNLVFLVFFASANPDPGSVWAYWIPRIGHDVLAVWSIVFWIWAVVDAYQYVRGQNEHEHER